MSPQMKGISNNAQLNAKTSLPILENAIFKENNFEINEQSPQKKMNEKRSKSSKPDQKKLIIEDSREYKVDESTKESNSAKNSFYNNNPLITA